MEVVTGAATGTGLAVVGQGLVSLAGFTSAGVAAGSTAAAIQGPAVVAGSAFSVMQSVGATGALLSVAPVAGIAGGVIGGGILIAKFLF